MKMDTGMNMDMTPAEKIESMQMSIGTGIKISNFFGQLTNTQAIQARESSTL